MADGLSQLARLARPFPNRFVHENPSGGGSYVTHSVVNEKLLAVLGGFDFELVEVLRGHVAGRAADPNASSKRGRDGTPALDGVVVGAVCRMSAVVDGRLTRVEDVGDCESPHNWPHDGARLKDAMSDALKRCAMRLGVGLHLWSQGEFTLFDQLWKAAGEPSEDEVSPMAIHELRARVASLGLTAWVDQQNFVLPLTRRMYDAIAAKCAIREEELSAPFVANEDGTPAPTLIDAQETKGKTVSTDRRATETAPL